MNQSGGGRDRIASLSPTPHLTANSNTNTLPPVLAVLEVLRSCLAGWLLSLALPKKIC